MPTFHLHLRNVPPAAGSKDIRQFFSKFDIPGGGVQIVGGLEGNAFVSFSNYEHLLEATSYNQKTFMGNKLEVCLVNGDDIKHVVENMMLDLGVHRELPGTLRSIEYPSASAQSSSHKTEHPSAIRITELPSDDQRSSQKTPTMGTPKAHETPPVKESRPSLKDDVRPERRRAATPPWELEPHRGGYGEGEPKRMRLSSQGKDDDRYSYDGDRPAESYKRDRVADPYSRDGPAADFYKKVGPTPVAYNRDRPVEPYNRDKPIDPYNRDRPSSDPYNRDLPGPYPYNLDRPADPYNRDSPAAAPYNRDRPIVPYNRDRIAAPHNRDRTADQERMQKELEIELRIAQDIADQLQKRKERIESIKRGIIGEPSLPQIAAPRADDNRRLPEPYARRPMQGEGEVYHSSRQKDEPRYGPNDGYGIQDATKPGPEAYYEDQRPGAHNEGYGEGDYNYSDPNASFLKEHGQYEYPGYDGRGDYYRHEAARYPAPPHRDPMYPGPQPPPSGPGSYPPSGPGPYPHSGPGPHPPRGPGPHPPRGPGPFPPRGAGPFPPRGPGPHPPRGPAQHPPRDPGPYPPRGPGPHLPSGPGPHPPRGPAPIPHPPSHYGGPHGGGEYKPTSGKQGPATPFYIKMTNIDRFVVPKQIEYFFAGYQICPRGIITKKGGYDGTLIAYVKFANIEEARTCHKKDGCLLGGRQVRIEVIPESEYEAIRETKPAASSARTVKKTQKVTPEHKPAATPAAASKKTQRVVPEVRIPNTAEQPANRSKQPPPQAYTGSVKRALFYIIIKGVPESATATSVWEQFGGPAGRSIGVLLLDKLVDLVDRMAFVAYENLDHRNEEAGLHDNVSSWTDMGVYATCGQFLPKGKLYQTSLGRDIEISQDSKDLFQQTFFGKDARKIKKTDKQKETDQLVLNKISKSLFPAIRTAVEHLYYLRLGALQPDTTACQVWSWFGGASGPAVHVILTPSWENHQNCAFVAFRDTTSRNEAFKKHPGSHTMGEARALRAISRASSHSGGEVYKSTVTGTDELMSEEQKAAFKANWYPIKDLAGLTDDNVYILMISGIPQNTSACKVWAWFDREKGPVKQVITMDQDKSCTAFVKFKTLSSCNTALTKYKSSKIVTTEEMIKMLASCHIDQHIHYSAPLGQHRLALWERDALVAMASTGQNTADVEEGTAYGENADSTEFPAYGENTAYENPWNM